VSAAVPDRYRGVWMRTLLETPGRREDSTYVRWLQTSRWHADLRVPPAARIAASQLALQQGFCGVTTVEMIGGTEVCRWHRRVDFQPPGPFPDAGRIVFDGPDRLVETGIHNTYLEVWERLPGSAGRFVVLEAEGAKLLVAGTHAMRVRPRGMAWPADTSVADTLADLQRRHPHAGLLDFEISFARLEGGRLAIERSTLPELEGTVEACAIRRRADDEAVVQGPTGDVRWCVLEWDAAGSTLA